MDTETIITQFEALERKIETMVEASKALEAANRELEAKVGRLEMALQQAQEMEQRNSETKDLIRSKIDGLLERLNGMSET